MNFAALLVASAKGFAGKLPATGKPQLKAAVKAPLGYQDVLLIIWAFVCKVVLAYLLPQMHPTARELFFLYFQPLAPMLMMLWLWSFSLRQFELKGIEYDLCYSNKEKRFLVGYAEIQKIAMMMSLLVLSFTTAFAYLCSEELYRVAQYLPVLLYIAIVLVIVWPFHWLNRPLRLFFCNTLQRVLLPVQEMTWSDFLLADILTSLAKPLADLDRAVCSMTTGPVLGPLTTPGTEHPGSGSGPCSPVSWHFLAALCLPFLIRFVQCVGVYWLHGNTAQLFNAAKYFSAFPALLLTTLEWEDTAEDTPFPFFRTWLLSYLLYTCYSFYWDVEQDWDMPWVWKPGAHWWGPFRLPSVRSDAAFSGAFYTWLLLSNLLLRFVWAHRLLGRLQLLPLVGMAAAMVEVFRRWQWIPVRFETELRKIRLRMSHSHQELTDA